MANQRIVFMLCLAALTFECSKDLMAESDFVTLSAGESLYRMRALQVESFSRPHSYNSEILMDAQRLQKPVLPAQSTMQQKTRTTINSDFLSGER